MRPGDLLDELVVGDAVAEAADHGRDLRVEHRMRDKPAEVEDDLDVLARRVEDLGDLASLAISAKNGARSMSGDSGSISAVMPGAAIWIRQTSGQ